MLRVENICKTFFAGTINEKKALQGLSLHLKPGDFVTVIGGNGAGKSTLMNSIAGVFPIDSGKIIIDGNDITKTPEHKRAKYIGRVFQDPMMGTAAGMMIEENLAIAARRGKTPGLKWGLDSDNQTWFSELLQELDLGLENRMTAKVLALTERIVNRDHLTTLMITHNMRDALRCGNRLIMLHNGRVIIDVEGEEKSRLTIPDLLKMFEQASGDMLDSDRLLLS